MKKVSLTCHCEPVIAVKISAAKMPQQNFGHRNRKSAFLPPSVREVARSAGGSRGVKKTCQWHVFSLQSRRLCRRSIHLELYRTTFNSLPQSRLRSTAPSQRGLRADRVVGPYKGAIDDVPIQAAGCGHPLRTGVNSISVGRHDLMPPQRQDSLLFNSYKRFSASSGLRVSTCARRSWSMTALSLRASNDT